MPLVRLFIQKTLQKPVPLVALQAKLCKVWGTTPQTTKLMLTSVDAWTSEEFGEDVYVSVRAKVVYTVHLPYIYLPSSLKLR